jgi:hypothetical protein
MKASVTESRQGWPTRSRLIFGFIAHTASAHWTTRNGMRKHSRGDVHDRCAFAQLPTMALGSVLRSPRFGATQLLTGGFLPGGQVSAQPPCDLGYIASHDWINEPCLDQCLDLRRRYVAPD